MGFVMRRIGMMKLADFEGQQYVHEVLLFVKVNGSAYVEEMLRGAFKQTTRPTISRALRKLESFGLITDKLEDRGAGGIIRAWYLTPFGEEVAGSLQQLDTLLKAHDRKAKRQNHSSPHRSGSLPSDSPE